ncbi:MAG: hypothetical protein ACJ76W_13050 [Chloroflexota bacterium]
MPFRRSSMTLAAALIVGSCLAACEAGPAPPTPPISPGTLAAPREVSIIARDWTFQPGVVDVVAGETVLLHVVNGGLDVHEAVIGDAAVQDAWERAEAAAAVGVVPGATPRISVDPSVRGLRIVVGSGNRADALWKLPSAAPAGELVVGCHIPGHWAKGMLVPIRFVEPGADLPKASANVP